MQSTCHSVWNLRYAWLFYVRHIDGEVIATTHDDWHVHLFALIHYVSSTATRHCPVGYYHVNLINKIDGSVHVTSEQASDLIPMDLHVAFDGIQDWNFIVYE